MPDIWLIDPPRLNGIEKRKEVLEGRSLAPQVKAPGILGRAYRQRAFRCHLGHIGTVILLLSPSSQIYQILCCRAVATCAGELYCGCSVMTHSSSSRAASLPELERKAGSTYSCLYEKGVAVPFSFSSFPVWPRVTYQLSPHSHRGPCPIESLSQSCQSSQNC